MIGVTITASEARRALRAYFREITSLDDAAADAADELAAEARRAAAGHPTPQARLAATALEVSRDTIRLGRPSGVNAGAGFPRAAIFGGRWPSLAPPRRGGYWLIPETYDEIGWMDPIADAVRTATRRLDARG